MSLYDKTIKNYENDIDGNFCLYRALLILPFCDKLKEMEEKKDERLQHLCDLAKDNKCLFEQLINSIKSE